MAVRQLRAISLGNMVVVSLKSKLNGVKNYILIIFSFTKMKYWIIVLFFLVSCSLQNSKNTAGNNDMIVVDLDNLPSDNKLLYSTFFSSYRIIPLETKNDCLIGQINQIYIANDTIFVLDSRSAKSVFAFTKNGEFIRKIGKSGKGPGEYMAPSIFKINEQNKEIYILDRNYQSIYRYDFTGQYLGNIKITGDRVHDFIINNQNHLYVNTEIFQYGNNKYLLRELSLKGEELNKWFPTPEYGKSWSLHVSTQSFFPTPKDIKFYEPYLDTIYSISPNGVKAFMCLSSKNLLTRKDLINFESARKNRTSKRFDDTNIKKIWGPTEFHEDNNMIFTVVRNKATPYFILFNKQNKHLTAANFFNFDDDLAFAPHTSPPFAGVHQSEFIKVIRPGELTDFKNKLLKNKKMLSEDLEMRLEHITEQSNPILIFYETKSEW